MHWIYILQCREGKLYVGETTRLFRRFWEHEDGEGGVNTSRMGVEKVLAIYKVVDLGRFLRYHQSVIDPESKYTRYVFSDKFMDDDKDYDGKGLENSLAERLMISRGEDWETVRGGEYVRFVIKYTKPESSPLDVLPFCKCGLPCDVKINFDKGLFYFRCPNKNLWEDVRIEFGLEDMDPCNFYQTYSVDAEKRAAWEKNLENRGQVLRDIVISSPWLLEVPTLKDTGYCLSCKSKTKTMLTHPYPKGPVRAVCLDCLLTKKDLEVKLSRKKKGGPKSRPRLIKADQQTSQDSTVAPATPKKDSLLDLLPDPVHEEGDLEDAVTDLPPEGEDRVEDRVEDVVKGEDTTKKPAAVKKTGPRDPSRSKKTYYKKPYHKK
jgi:hypothetical protein